MSGLRLLLRLLALVLVLVLLMLWRVVAIGWRRELRRGNRHWDHGRGYVLGLVGRELDGMLLLVMNGGCGCRWLLVRLRVVLLLRWRGTRSILHLDVVDISRGDLEALNALCGVVPDLQDDAPARDDALDLAGDGVGRYLHADEHDLARERVAVGSHVGRMMESA